MKKISVFACAMLVSGCLPEGSFEMTPTNAAGSLSTPTMVSGDCGAAGLQSLMNQNESALAAVTLPEGTRIIRPGTVFTRDAVRSRLNIGITANGTIVHVACG